MFVMLLKVTPIALPPVPPNIFFDPIEEESDEEVTSSVDSFTVLQNPVLLDQGDQLKYNAVCRSVDDTWIELLRLKTENNLSTIVMNKIIKLVQVVKADAMPHKYIEIEDTLQLAHNSIQTAFIQGRAVDYVPVHRWIPIWIQLNLLDSLITVPQEGQFFGDISTGKWFRRFILRVPNGRSPIALNVYYDGWSTSNTGKLGGLYVTIANIPPSLLMKTDNKFVCSLVPTGVHAHKVLELVFNDYLIRKGIFDIEVQQYPFLLYMEVARLVGDIPGTSDLLEMLNHRGNSCCRKCKKQKHELQNYTLSAPKTQADLSKVLHEWLPKLFIRGHKQEAKEKLKEVGLRGTIPFWMKLPPEMEFDMCSHGSICLLHNEELGMLLTEIEGFWKSFTAAEKRQIGANMKDLPKIPTLPAFKNSFFEHLSKLLAKEVISICKGILFVTYPFCIVPNHLDDPETSLYLHSKFVLTVFTEEEEQEQQHYKIRNKKWFCLKRHIKYCNMLAQPKLAKSLVQLLHLMIVAYNNKFKKLYPDILPDDSEMFKPHLSLHWKEDIRKWGMPIYFSAQHWEPKHKQLKLQKENQTNNHNHARDLLHREHIKQLERCTSWQTNTIEMPDFEVLVYFFYKYVSFFLILCLEGRFHSFHQMCTCKES